MEKVHCDFSLEVDTLFKKCCLVSFPFWTVRFKYEIISYFIGESWGGNGVRILEKYFENYTNPTVRCLVLSVSSLSNTTDHRSFCFSSPWLFCYPLPAWSLSIVIIVQCVLNELTPWQSSERACNFAWTSHIVNPSYVPGTVLCFGNPKINSRQGLCLQGIFF